MSVESNYQVAKELNAQYGIDTDAVLEKLSEIPVSVHCWQIDDLTGFEDFNAKLSGGLAATGNAGGKPKSVPEYFENLTKALKLIPGKKKVAAHAIYLDNGGVNNIDRNAIEPKHFTHWVDYAKEMGIGLDFNPTYFNHAKAEDGFTLSSYDEGIRQFWVEHGKRCRKIGEYFGKEMGQVCYTNHWIPDGYKDITVDKMGPREVLIRSLDEIFAEKIDPAYNVDSVESKLFGLCRGTPLSALVETRLGISFPSRAFEKGGIQDAIAYYEDGVFYDILAEELARRDLEEAGETGDPAALNERMDRYIEEFNENGVDRIQIEGMEE